MWVSNTATVVMMLPIAMSVVELVRRELRVQAIPMLRVPVSSVRHGVRAETA